MQTEWLRLTYRQGMVFYEISASVAYCVASTAAISSIIMMSIYNSVSIWEWKLSMSSCGSSENRIYQHFIHTGATIFQQSITFIWLFHIQNFDTSLLTHETREVSSMCYTNFSRRDHHWRARTIAKTRSRVLWALLEGASQGRTWMWGKSFLFKCELWIV